MNARARLGLAFVALLLPPIAVAMRGEPRPWQGPVLEQAIPTQLDGFAVAHREQLDAEIAAVVRPSDYVFWQYHAEGRIPIVAYVAAYANIRDLGAGAHDPRLCYPAQGWEILATEEIAVPVEDASFLRATLMRSQQSSRRELVLFWIQPAGRWPSSPALEQVLGLRDAILGADRYVFVRLSTPGDGPAEADQLVEFASSLAPQVRAFLDGLR